jgi:hypothetical protein
LEAAAGEVARETEGLAVDGREPPGLVAGARLLGREAVDLEADGPVA